MSELKLIALDAEDLAVLSAHLQDAVGRVADLSYQAKDQRFVGVFNRFDWRTADEGTKQTSYERRQTGVRFEKVTRAQVSGFNINDKDQVLSLLAISFDEGEAPAGVITLQFSGGAGIQLHVSYIEAELKDLGAAWATQNVPSHLDDGEVDG